MTIFPELLYFREKCKIDRQVFEDLRLTELLSDKALEILARPAAKEEIAARQGLFSCLDDASFHARFESCRSSLIDLRNALSLYEDCATDLQKYHLFVLLLRAHLDAVSLLSEFSGCARLDEIGSYCSVWLQSAEAEKERNDLARAAKSLAAMAKTHLQIGFKSYLCPPEETSGYAGQVDGWAKEWGYETLKETGIRVSPGEALTGAFSRLFSAEFSELEMATASYERTLFAPPVELIGQMDFYLEIHDLILRAKKAGMPTCIPSISSSRLVAMKNAWDAALLQSGKPIVPNDVLFDEQTPFYFLLGANGGGKTTYLRALAVDLILFAGGCPVFAEYAEIYPFEKIGTHFPRDERFSFVGRLDEERARSETLLEKADRNGFLFYNETFSGTDEEKGLTLTLDAAKRIYASCAFGLYVTHFHGVEAHGYPILSAVVGENGERTWRIVPKSAKGNSYAADVLKKYKLDPVSLFERTVPKE